jgi:uncharacterized protein (DUF4415 family)
MNDATSSKTSSGTRTGTDWKRLREMTDEEIHRSALGDPDAQPTPDDPDWWSKARVVWPDDRPKKEAITIRLDADVLRWFRRDKGYQTHINAVLRSYMLANPRGDEDEG